MTYSLLDTQMSLPTRESLKQGVSSYFDDNPTKVTDGKVKMEYLVVAIVSVFGNYVSEYSDTPGLDSSLLENYLKILLDINDEQLKLTMFAGGFPNVFTVEYYINTAEVKLTTVEK